MAMRQKSEARQKTKLIQVRATPEEKIQLQARAAVFGISMGELVRQTLFGSKPKSKTDQVAIQVLADTRADLGRMGGLLKGWLAGSFPGSPPPPSQAEIRKLLREIEAGQKAVLEAVIRLSDKA